MVVAGRLQWVAEKIRLGHQVLVTSSFSIQRQRQKLKVLIQPLAGVIIGPEINQCFAMAAVTNLLHIVNTELLASNFCIMDRGHKHSDGVSEVVFWMEVKVEIVSECDEGTDVTTAVKEDVACPAVDTNTLATPEIEDDDDGDDGFEDVGAETGRLAEDVAGAGGLRGVGGSCDGSVDCGVVLTGIGVDMEDLGLASRVSSSEGATGSIDRSTDVQEEGGSRQKKPRILVEM